MPIPKITDFFKKYRKALSVIGRIFSVVFSLVLVVFCSMLSSIGETDFDFKGEFTKNLKSPLTWVLAVAIALAWAVIYTVFFTFVKEKKLADNISLFKEFSEKNKNKPHNFGDYLKRVENIRRKKTAYIEKMENKLAVVQNLMEKIPLEKHNTKRYLKLKRKEEDILFKSTPKYISEHILSLSVKYNKVSIEHFTFAITTARVTDKTNSEEHKLFARKVFGKIIFGVLIGISGVSILSTLTVIFNWKDSGMWVTLLMIIITLFVQVYMASLDAETITDSEIIAPTETKIKIIDESLLWKEADLSNKPFENIVNKWVAEHQPKEETPKEKPKVQISMAELEYLQKHREEINQQIEKEVTENGTN